MSKVLLQSSDDSVDFEEDTLAGKYLTFSIGAESYGIEIRHVIEIIKLQPMTAVPEMPDYIQGVMNLRGQIFPVMDVRKRFKKESGNYNDRTCIVVIDVNGLSIGLIVDSVSEVLAISNEDIVSPPDLGGDRQRYIDGICRANGEVKLLVNASKLIADKDLEYFQ